LSRSDLYLVGDAGHENNNPTISIRWLPIINGMGAVWLEPGREDSVPISLRRRFSVFSVSSW